jgi:aspartyl-tRNA(Asn)/glutamyl-tRNA(Gln) amidotransferase subunit C
MTAKVTEQDVHRVAELAHLELTPEESGRMLKDLNAILDYVAELNQLDTAGVAPLAQVSELGACSPPTSASRLSMSTSGLRSDHIVPSLDRAVVMREAPETDGAFFKVPKVIER